MARGKSSSDQETLKMALVGYQAERQKIDDKISQLEALIEGKTAAAPDAMPARKSGRKRVLSAAARKRIAAAQKKRWAEHRKLQSQSKGE